MLKIAIIAGGLAKRLGPLTKNTPKSLLEINGKPFLNYQLKYIKNQGITDIVICVGHFNKAIENYAKDGKLFGLKISYSYDGSDLLGTGGALKKALSVLGNNFFVIYGDSFLPINFRDIYSEFLRFKPKALMTIINNKNKWDTSNVSLLNDNYIHYNKHNTNKDMEYIDYGLSIINADTFKNFNNSKKFDLADFYSFLSKKNELMGYEVYDRFYEIGSIKGLAETRKFLKRENL